MFKYEHKSRCNDAQRRHMFKLHGHMTQRLCSD